MVKGGGDLGTGVAYRLHRVGFRVLVTELERPTVIRRPVAFAEAVYEGAAVVEGVTARLVRDTAEAMTAWEQGEVAVLIDHQGEAVGSLQPGVLVDAIMAKRNTGTSLRDAPVVVALGPGFAAGRDAHAVIETQRGHFLGRVIRQGEAMPNTGIPGEIGGASVDRLLRAPADGVFQGKARIGDRVKQGQVVALVGGVPMRSGLSGVLRGLLRDGLSVKAGTKSGDVDPRADPSHCFTISDKALAVAGGALEAVLALWPRAESP
ncbi:MAG: EF2563 family selenium-dependent molybdenum hydroxylase system protein [Firmicutes bacterium]|nr:EF2563 family selenium-dependent molybdenum hydroxylase system protein [Bacillota bacterium]